MLLDGRFKVSQPFFVTKWGRGNSIPGDGKGFLKTIVIRSGTLVV